MNRTFAGFHQRKFCRMVHNVHNHQIPEASMEITAYLSLCEQTNQLIIQKHKQRKLLPKKDNTVEDTQAFVDFDNAVNKGAEHSSCVFDAAAYYSPQFEKLKAQNVYLGSSDHLICADTETKDVGVSFRLPSSVNSIEDKRITLKVPDGMELRLFKDSVEFKG